MGTKTKIWIAIILGLIIRLILVPLHININDDLIVHEEWGRVFQITGANYFYFFDGWVYSFPTQPPLTSLMFALAYRVYDMHLQLANMHNQIGLPPGFVVKYYYDYGYFLLLKLPAILADIGLGLLIYKVINQYKSNKSLPGLYFYLLNPVTIFLSGIWGQTESLIALFGMLAFFALSKKAVYWAIPFYFISLYFKPTWGVFIPLFVFILFLIKPKITHLVIGSLSAFAIYFIATTPFADGNLISFTKEIVIENMLPIAKGTARATVSAFNMHGVLFSIDGTLADAGLGIINPTFVGIVSFLLVNIITLKWLYGKSIETKNIIIALFVIGAGSFLLLANMLERYIFIAYPALVIIMFIDKKIFFWGLVMNIAIFVNLVWAFYRRSNADIASLFALANGLLVRAFSLSNVLAWFQIARKNVKI